MTKMLLLALILPCLPPGEAPDPEVATNLALRTMPRHLAAVVFQIDCDANPTHEIALALGTDADADGDLSFEETSLIFGNDCGSFYLADLDAGQVDTVATNALVLARRDWNFGWNLLKIVKRGAGDFAPVLTEATTFSPFVIRIR